MRVCRTVRSGLDTKGQGLRRNSDLGRRIRIQGQIEKACSVIRII